MSELGRKAAFPRPVAHAAQRCRMAQFYYSEPQEGMTLREHYAGEAMKGLLSDHKDHSDERADGETCPQTVARLAVEHADELIAYLEKHPAK